MRRFQLTVRSINPDELTLEHLAALAGMHPAAVERLVECGLLQPVAASGSILLFDPSKALRLRSINRLRSELGINLQGIAVVLDLVERLRDLERENSSLRAKL